MKKKRIVRRKRSGLALGMLAVALLLPWRVGAETLEAALAQALANNPDIQAQRALARAAGEGVAQAEAGALPQIGVSLSTGYQRNTAYYDGVGANASNREQNFTLHPSTNGIQLTQPLYSGGKIPARIRQAGGEAEAARFQTEATVQSVLSQAAQAYCDVALAQENVNSMMEHEQAQREALEEARVRQRLGAAARTDTAQAESRWQKALSDLARAQGKLRQAGAAYQQVIGARPGTLTMPQPFPGLPKHLDEALAMVDANPNVKAAQQAREAASASREVAAGAHLPDVSLTASYGRQYEATQRWVTALASYVGVQLTVPLYAGGAINSKERQAQESFQQKTHQLQSARMAVESSIVQAWEGLKAAGEAFNASRKQIGAAKTARDAMAAGVKAGAQTTLDLLNAQDELSSARLATYQAGRDYVVLSYQLGAALGLLRAE